MPPKEERQSTSSNNSKKIRGGHRAYVSKQISEVKDALEDGTFLQKKSKILSFKRRLEKICTILAGLDEIILENCSEEEVENEIMTSSMIHDEIQEMIIEIDEKLELSPKESMKNTDPNDSHCTNSINTRLPEIVLPEFHGNPLEWQSFWDIFNEAIETKEIDDIMKFNYLKGVLRGPAAASIFGLTLTSKNYKEAIEILKNRYGNKQLIISSHMEKLLSINSVTSVYDITKIRSLYDELENHVRNLKSLQIDAKQYGPVLISIVMFKLPVTD